MSDLVHDLSRSRLMTLERESLPELRRLAADLAGEGRVILDAEGVPPAAQDLSLTADLRYHGQAFELMIPVPAGVLDDATLETLTARFHALHEQRFSYADASVPVELVTLRLTATGRLGKPLPAPDAAASGAGEVGARRMRLAGGWVSVPVHRRETIGPDAALAGPLAVEEEYTSILMTAGWLLTRSPGGHLIARRGAPT